MLDQVILRHLTPRLIIEPRSPGISLGFLPMYRKHMLLQVSDDFAHLGT